MKLRRDENEEIQYVVPRLEQLEDSYYNTHFVFIVHRSANVLVSPGLRSTILNRHNCEASLPSLQHSFARHRVSNACKITLTRMKSERTLSLSLLPVAITRTNVEQVPLNIAKLITDEVSGLRGHVALAPVCRGSLTRS